jgi:hypothetical protein
MLAIDLGVHQIVGRLTKEFDVLLLGASIAMKKLLEIIIELWAQERQDELDLVTAVLSKMLK